MANITIQIPDAQMNNVIEAFTKFYGYQDVIPGPMVDGVPGPSVPNPETKAQFAQKMVRNYIKDTVANFQGQAASLTAAQDARDKIG